MYAILWTMGGTGHRVLSYRGSYSDIDFYNVRLLFGNFMATRSRELLVKKYREAGVQIAQADEN